MFEVPKFYGTRSHAPSPSWFWSEAGQLIFVCPNGHHGWIADHEIDDKGVVTASVLCSRDDKECTFHEHCVFKDWSAEDSARWKEFKAGHK